MSYKRRGINKNKRENPQTQRQTNSERCKHVCWRRERDININNINKDSGESERCFFELSLYQQENYTLFAPSFAQFIAKTTGKIVSIHTFRSLCEIHYQNVSNL